MYRHSDDCECPWCKRGIGCSHCYDGQPVVAFDWGKLCFSCLVLWFPTLPVIWLENFIDGQLAQAVEQDSAEYAERMAAIDEIDLKQWMVS